MGRVAVIGGSEDYTGAPYFSAMASARLGADMVGKLQHVPSHIDQQLTTKPRAM
jgi:NAD(P)H-hydrate repair Nnr-like enzyme with NAD(P)H-hydrate dehydratase domain